MRRDRGRFGTAVLVGIGLVGATVARADDKFDVKLGLWEVTSTTEMSGMPPIDTSKLTPEQRARLEAAMKARQGTQTRTSKSCLTKEKLEKELFPVDKDDGSCKRTVISSSRTLREEKFECADRNKMTGHLRFEAASRERVNGTVQMKAGEGAQVMTGNSTLKAKWLGADCGDVR
jgi:hypothetical protein